MLPGQENPWLAEAARDSIAGKRKMSPAEKKAEQKAKLKLKQLLQKAKASAEREAAKVKAREKRQAQARAKEVRAAKMALNKLKRLVQTSRTAMQKRVSIAARKARELARAQDAKIAAHGVAAYAKVEYEKAVSALEVASDKYRDLLPAPKPKPAKSGKSAMKAMKSVMKKALKKKMIAFFARELMSEFCGKRWQRLMIFQSHVDTLKMAFASRKLN